jgi:hypothetical protein
MAKIKKNSFLQGLSGSVGEMVFRQMPDGSTRVSAKPINKRRFNQEQKGCQDRMRLAVAYAKEAKTDPFYVGFTLEKGRDAYHLALSDGLTPPVIHEIERRDGRVRVTASDDVMVAKVRVSIRDEEGNLLEQGYVALPDPIHDPERWEYASSAEGTIEATAWDLAHNRATATLSLPRRNLAGLRARQAVRPAKASARDGGEAISV